MQDRLNDVRRILVLKESRTRTESNSSVPLHTDATRGQCDKILNAKASQASHLSVGLFIS